MRFKPPALRRFLNDVNHRVTHWQFFIGAEQADPNGNTGRLLKYETAPFQLTVLQKYYYFQQLADTFGVGAVFRHSLSSLEGEMNYAYGKKPRVNAAVARNPDGSWGVGLANFTAPEFRDADDPNDFALHNSGYAAKRFAVTVRVPELAALKTLRFAVRRSNSGVNNATAGTLLMRNGEITVPDLAPLDLITLRSEKASVPRKPASIGPRLTRAKRLVWLSPR